MPNVGYLPASAVTAAAAVWSISALIHIVCEAHLCMHELFLFSIVSFFFVYVNLIFLLLEYVHKRLGVCLLMGWLEKNLI